MPDGAPSSLLLEIRRACRDVVRASLNQEMQAQTDEADGRIVVLALEVLVLHVGGIDDGHATAADHFQPIVGVDEDAAPRCRSPFTDAVTGPGPG